MSPFLVLSRVRTRSLISICIALVVVALLWTSRQSAATTITVNSTSDVANASDGLCTLREAITAANNNTASGATAGECAAGSSTGSDTITISVSGTINLTGALPQFLSDINLSGPGSSLLTVRRDTGGNYRVLDVAGGVVTMSGLTVTNGRTADGAGGEGGGIRNTSNLTLSDVTVINNTAGSGIGNGSGSPGGGIFSNGPLTMTNCLVNQNHAGKGGSADFPGPGGNGGAISASSTLTMSNCVVSGNTAGDSGDATAAGSGTFGGSGGGILAGGNTVLVNTAITNNIAGGCPHAPSNAPGVAGEGGGIRIGGATSTLRNVTVAMNSTSTNANGVVGLGGGISAGGTTTIIGSTINGNFGSPAAGIQDAGQMTITNTTVSGNPLGYGIMNGGGSLTLTNSTITANGDAGVFSTSTNAVGNTIIAGNNAFGDVLGGFTSKGHNFIGKSDGNLGFVNGTKGDQVGTPAAPIDPLLAALANNGGPTQTHALRPGSPALDAGDNTLLPGDTLDLDGDGNTIEPVPYDQRGFARIVNTTVDIGAYETSSMDIPDASTNEDTQLVVSFDPGNTSTISSMTASSSNASVVPNDSAHLSVALTGAAGILTINPSTNAVGATNITVTINRTAGGPDVKTFALTVTAVNDAPRFTKGVDQTVNEDAGPQTVPNWATNISPGGGADESGQTVTFQVANDNPSLFSVAPAISPSGTLTYTPASNQNGLAGITVTLKDTGGTANGGNDTSLQQTFTITVNPVNDAPSFTKGPDQTVNEDAGAQTVFGWATAIATGPGVGEPGQTVTFQVVGNTNPALFSAGPAINVGGTLGALSYTPAANANGSATITINLKDNGGTANGGVDTSPSQSFVITVNPVNDAPSFTKGANQTVNNNAGPQTVTNWATNISAGPSNESSQNVTFQVAGNTNAALFTAGPAISPAGTLTYTPSLTTGGTATITINLKDDGGTANGGADTSASQTFTITTTNPAGGFINFQSSAGNTTENSGSTTVNVVRSGNTSAAVAVIYATNADPGLPCSTANGVASPKCDFTAALGTLNFAAGETSKPITILISQDSFVEGPEVITLTLSSPTGGAALGTPSTMSVTIADDATEPSTNIIDDPNQFVRMHYHDFLNREGDQSGIDFWTGQMSNCGSPDPLVCKVNVSGAFFLSIEFQQTGYLVERIYKTAYGDATGTSTIGGSHQIFVPVVRANEFLADTQRVGRGVVVGQTGWETVLENNKQAYALEFVQTSRFTAAGAFPTSLTPSQFVDKLNTNAGNVLSPSERTTAINLFGNAADTTNVNARAQALRQVAEDQDLFNAEFRRAFVLAEYIGYVRRNPNDLPDSDYTGYDFWLAKLNQFNGNYIQAEMVKAFISSSEYRQRFGP
jgi:CSLREA domain-containing protein